MTRLAVLVMAAALPLAPQGANLRMTQADCTAEKVGSAIPVSSIGERVSAELSCFQP